MIWDCADIYNSLIVCTILKASASGASPSTQWDMDSCGRPGHYALGQYFQLPLSYLYCLTIYLVVLAGPYVL